MLRFLVAASIGTLALLAQPASRARGVDFERDIAPVLRASCQNCHNGQNASGKLNLESESSVLRGGVSGPAIVPGRSSESVLVKRLLGAGGGPRMPVGGDPLPSARIDLVRRWIDETTAPDPMPIAHVGESPLFATKIRPILAQRCSPCHGPEVQENGLRLDSLAGILKGSESSPIVVRGKSGDSRLMRRLTGEDRPQMPYGAPPLSAGEIGSIREWIDAGAPGPDVATAEPVAKRPLHWAYVKPARPPVPHVKDSSWCRTPIDRFVLARLEKEGLKPSPEADKNTLARRVCLDLTGLPPSPQEVDDFASDQSPDAYEKLVDRMLSSPHYGERWAGPWLDLARYADTNGYERDVRRSAWPYRDWVIKALNQDMSFKQFTIEQIAGDMLPNATAQQRIASGFHRNTLLNQESGVDAEEYYWHAQSDRVNTTGLVWLGATLSCAQCHNHKFDPFTQKDYYRFLAFFNNGVRIGPREEPSLALPTPEQAEKAKSYREQMAKLQSTLNTQTPELAAPQQVWEADIRTAGERWQVLVPARYESSGRAALKLLPDASILAGGANPEADSYTVEAKIGQAAITGVRLEVLADPSLPHTGPGRDPDGNFFLSDFEVEAAPAGDPQAKQRVIWKDAKANESQTNYEIGNLLRKDAGARGWAIDPAPSDSPLPRQAVLIPEKPFGFPGGTILVIRLKHQLRHASRNIGRFRLSVTSGPDPAFIVRLPVRMFPVLQTPAERRTPEQSEKLASAFRTISPLLDPARKQLAALKDALQKLGIVTAMVMEERSGYERPSAYIRERGSFLSKGDLVYADVPAALNPLPKDAMPNRLGLAAWLVSEENPLTARVTVNRLWETLFGHGIVETSEDFGTQGDPPTHPELLDWLATEFMHDGWSMKRIVRRMVTSATYRQSSRVTRELEARDPYNKLYARGPKVRAEAEMVYDIILSASGLLSPKMYGPSVFPFQPEGIWDLPTTQDRWVESTGEDRYRRAIYTFRRRSAPYPGLATFDAPSREFCVVRRARTNTPLQALTALNDPYFFEAARALARRMVKESDVSSAGRATHGFRLCVSRRPSAAELQNILRFYDAQLTNYSNDPEAARRVIGQADSRQDAAELAAWTMVANVLLNMDETISNE